MLPLITDNLSGENLTGVTPLNGYWLKIRTKESDGFSDSQDMSLLSIRPIYYGVPNYVSYSQTLGPITDPNREINRWDMTSPTTTDAPANGAYISSDNYNDSTYGESPYGKLTIKVPFTGVFVSGQYDISKIVTEWNTSYYFLLKSSDESTILSNFFLRKTDVGHTYVDIIIENPNNNSGITTLKVVKNEPDPTKIKIKFDPIKDTQSFVSYQLQMKTPSMTESQFVSIGSAITNIGTSEYVIMDTDTITGDITPQTNGQVFDIRLKINLVGTGFVTEYAPVLYSNIVQTYRPGMSVFTMNMVAPSVQSIIPFTYTSQNVDDKFTLSKRIITWGDGTVGENVLDSNIYVADTGTTSHKYNQYYDFTSTRPTIQWETSLGLRSVATNCTTSFEVYDSPPLSILNKPKDKIYLGDSIVLSGINSKAQSNSSISYYKFYNGSTFATNQTSSQYTLTPSTSTTLDIALTVLDDNNIYGSGFDWVAAYTQDISTEVSARYYDLCSSYIPYTKTTADTTNDINLIMGESPIFLFSKTPFNGLVLKLHQQCINEYATLKYWNGTSFVKITNTPEIDLYVTDFQITKWANLPLEVPMTPSQIVDNNIIIGDTTNSYYCVSFGPTTTSGAYGTDLIISKLITGINFHQIEVISNTPILINYLKDVKISSISHELPRSWIKNILDGNAGVSLTDGGSGGHTISGNGVVMKDNSLFSGHGLLGGIKHSTGNFPAPYSTRFNCFAHGFSKGDRINITNSIGFDGSYYVTPLTSNVFSINRPYTDADVSAPSYVTNMSSMDILRKIQVEGSYVQISGTDSNDLYRGRANISWKKNAGDTRIVPFQIKVDVDSVLVYVEETFAWTTTPPLRYIVADIDCDGEYSDDIICTTPFDESGSVTIDSFDHATNVLTISGTATNVKVKYWTIRSI